MSYYYTCGRYRDTILATCIRSETGFQEFDDPHNYTQITRITLTKRDAETLMNHVILRQFDTIEEKTLCTAMKTLFLEIVKK
jgi:hypothetical protein